MQKPHIAPVLYTWQVTSGVSHRRFSILGSGQAVGEGMPRRNRSSSSRGMPAALPDAMRIWTRAGGGGRFGEGLPEQSQVVGPPDLEVALTGDVGRVEARSG